MTETSVPPTDRPRATYKDIHGWFARMDVELFRAFFAAQEDTPPGDLGEIGVFKGKSAVVIGEALRPGEQFVAIDLFGDMSLLGESDDDRENASENRRYYPSLDRTTFEQNYLSVHDELPVVVQAPSARILEYVEPGAARFVHIDASHLYLPVAEDARNTKTMLRPGGVVAFDDWRNHKCPGVAAAIWESVITDGLIPIATTRNKLYGVWSGADEATAVVRDVLAARPDWWVYDEHEIFGYNVLRLDNAPGIKRERLGKQLLAEEYARRQARREAREAAKTAGPAPKRSLKSYVAAELAPPLLVDWLRSRRH